MRVVIGVMTESRQDDLASDATRFLVARRLRNRPYPGCWEFPGGKVNVSGESVETDAHALAREWDEELELKVSVGQHPIYEGTFLHEATEKLFTVVVYQVTRENDEQCPIMLDHDAIGWYTRKEIESFEKKTPSTLPILRSFTKKPEVKEESLDGKRTAVMMSTKVSGGRERAIYKMKAVDNDAMWILDFAAPESQTRNDSDNKAISFELKGSTNLLRRDTVLVSDLLEPVKSKSQYVSGGDRNLKATPVLAAGNEVTITIEGKKPPMYNEFPSFFWVFTEPFSSEP